MISIVLPTYNRAHVIGKAIESVIQQTYTDWELIICDDCSTDNTWQVITQYKLQYPGKILCHRNRQNVGLPGNRNTGIKLARGELIYFLEDDVVLGRDCLKELYFNPQHSAGIGVVGPRSIEKEKPGKLMAIERKVADSMRKKMGKPSYISPWTGLIFQNFNTNGLIMESDVLPSWSLFNKQAINDIDGYSDAYDSFNYSHEETDLFVRLRKAGYEILFNPQAIAYHNHDSKGGTRTTPLRYVYYYLGAHFIFLRRNYGWRTVYMMPLCLIYLAIQGLRYAKTD